MENLEVRTKKCSKCGKELPASEFYVKKWATDGLQAWCKECQKTSNYKRFASKAHCKGCNPDLAQFTPRQLIEELRARGYTGELKYVQTIKI